MNNNLNQWHGTSIESSNGTMQLIKRYLPESYEIQNEIKWLTSNILKDKTNFKVPQVFDYSFEKGEVIMEYIEECPKENEIIRDCLVNCAYELHSILKSDEPILRTSVTKVEYHNYLLEYINKRVATLNTYRAFDGEVLEWINDLVQHIHLDYFTIVHRDLRLRHLLFSSDQQPTLIDWEFANISLPAQDLAKLIYDCSINNEDYLLIKDKVISLYHHISNFSIDYLENNIRAFLPIIPLEHVASLIYRKPIGFEVDVLKDIKFIELLYQHAKK